MDNYPRTLAEFESQFSSERACREYLFHLRWPDGFVCPHCGYKKGWQISNMTLECASCSYQCSVTAGTIFHRTRLPLQTWFRAIWWVTSQKTGASALGLQHILGLGSYRTAWSWLHKLRRAMVRPGRERLSGTIEMDEIYVGGEKEGKRGRGAAGKSLVVIATEINKRRIGRIRLCRVDNASADNLGVAAQESIELGAVIHTDGWVGYNRLGSLGYIHEIVRDDGEIGENLLPSCHRVAALLKRWLLGTHQGAISHEHLDYYLDEFTFRFNRRTSRHRGKLFLRLLENAMEIEPVTYKQLSKGIRGRKPGNTTGSET